MRTRLTSLLALVVLAGCGSPDAEVPAAGDWLSGVQASIAASEYAIRDAGDALTATNRAQGFPQQKAGLAKASLSCLSSCTRSGAGSRAGAVPKGRPSRCSGSRRVTRS